MNGRTCMSSIEGRRHVNIHNIERVQIMLLECQEFFIKQQSCNNRLIYYNKCDINSKNMSK